LNTVYLGLGSNVDAEPHIRAGIAALRALDDQLVLSPVYRSPAMGFDGDDFLNLVACIRTQLSPLQLKQALHEIEDRHGRKRDVPKFSDRTLDIDILLYNDLWLRSPELEIPRDEILTAPHVLKPLADIAANVHHPIERQSFSELWNSFQGRKDGLILTPLTS
jgi:2-amino-4-hydroxy-6-hydroxymethyldihydropteridine diphosphokinase